MPIIKKIHLLKDIQCVKCRKVMKAGEEAVKDGRKGFIVYYHPICPKS